MSLGTFTLVALMASAQLHAAETADGVPFGTYKPSEFSGKVVVVNWYDKEGQKRIRRSDYKNDFYQLAHFFAPQIYGTFCGIASSSMVLNALRVPEGEAPNNPLLAMKMPKVWGGDTKQFTFYTQETFFNDKTEKVKPRSVIALKNISAKNTNNAKAFDPGLKLAELKGVLEAHDAVVDMRYADLDEKKGVDRFRKDIKRVLDEDEHFIIVNLLGKPLGMNSGGHISPIAAYDQKTDSVLVLEVAATKRPWLWVPVRDLYLSMHTKDGDTYRGYLIVSDPEQLKG